MWLGLISVNMRVFKNCLLYLKVTKRLRYSTTKAADKGINYTGFVIFLKGFLRSFHTEVSELPSKGSWIFSSSEISKSGKPLWPTEFLGGTYKLELFIIIRVLIR
ncbi:MAG TPA: hypothetical protein VN373_01420, partial [Methanosarcina barkeri]|nr:hypothetical protein [Methanosarcina barkeri]